MFCLFFITVFHLCELKPTPCQDLVTNWKMKKTLRPTWRWKLGAMKIVIEGMKLLLTTLMQLLKSNKMLWT